MVVNGSGRPVLYVVDATHNIHNPVVRVVMPYCDKLTETFEPLYSKHRVQGGWLTEGIGVIYSCRLDYSSFLDGQVLLDMSQAFQIAASKEFTAKGMVLMPRIDAPERQYHVIFNKSFDMSLIAGHGHGDIVFDFLSVDIEPSIPIIRTGYGTHYGGMTSTYTASAGYGYEL